MSDTTGVGPEGASPLAALLTHIRGQSRRGERDEGGALQELDYFRATWARLGVERKLSRALAQAPENAGPLNSHFLVLQAVKQMRAISPGYLEHFLSWVDTLLWLEQADPGGRPAHKAATRAERDRKRKPARGGGD